MAEIDSQISDYDAQQFIWRYFDWPKFCYFVLSKRLVFCRADMLRKLDLHEGAPPHITYSKSLIKAKEVSDILNVGRKKKIDYKQFHRKTFESDRKHYFISCWHMNHTESEAMWPLYTGRETGIAVRSKICKVRDFCLRAHGVAPINLAGGNKGYSFFCGNVHYIDYTEYKKERPFVFELFFLKREGYKHENEFRFLLWQPLKISTSTALGMSDISEVIDEVVVHPEAPKWHVDVVRSLLSLSASRISVRESTLRIAPLV